MKVVKNRLENYCPNDFKKTAVSILFAVQSAMVIANSAGGGRERRNQLLLRMSFILLFVPRWSEALQGKSKGECSAFLIPGAKKLSLRFKDTAGTFTFRDDFKNQQVTLRRWLRLPPLVIKTQTTFYSFPLVKKSKKLGSEAPSRVLAASFNSSLSI